MQVYHSGKWEICKSLPSYIFEKVILPSYISVNGFQNMIYLCFHFTTQMAPNKCVVKTDYSYVFKTCNEIDCLKNIMIILVHTYFVLNHAW